MAVYNIVFVAVTLFSATSYGAPTQDVDAVIKVPAECKDQQFCSVKPEGYDDLEAKINSVLPEFLIKDYADRDGEAPLEGPQLSPKEDWHNCPYETKTESMYLYNHGENNTRTEIIVQTKLFRQYVNVVTCATQYIDKDSEEQCFQDLGVSAFHMRSACETTTAKRTLYVFDIDRSKVIQKSFEVPACCTCRVSYKV